MNIRTTVGAVVGAGAVLGIAYMSGVDWWVRGQAAGWTWVFTICGTLLGAGVAKDTE